MRSVEEITVEDPSALQNTLPPSTHWKVMARMAASAFPASYRERGSRWDSSSLGRGWKHTGFLGGLTITAVSGFSQSSMQMKTAAIKMVSCATTYSARKKASCISGGYGGHHDFCPSLTARGSAHTHSQQNCPVRLPGREMPNGSGTEDKKTPK